MYIVASLFYIYFCYSIILHFYSYRVFTVTRHAKCQYEEWILHVPLDFTAPPNQTSRISVPGLQRYCYISPILWPNFWRVIDFLFVVMYVKIECVQYNTWP